MTCKLDRERDVIWHYDQTEHTVVVLHVKRCADTIVGREFHKVLGRYDCWKMLDVTGVCLLEKRNLGCPGDILLRKFHDDAVGVDGGSPFVDSTSASYKSVLGVDMSTECNSKLRDLGPLARITLWESMFRAGSTHFNCASSKARQGKGLGERSVRRWSEDAAR